MSSLPPALAPVLQSLLHARYGPEQREECAGWRGVFEERAADGVLVATRDVEAGEVNFSLACVCVVCVRVSGHVTPPSYPQPFHKLSDGLPD